MVPAPPLGFLIISGHGVADNPVTALGRGPDNSTNPVGIVGSCAAIWNSLAPISRRLDLIWPA